MTTEEYLRELATAITQQEDITDAEAKDVLFELALRIYALLLAQLPDGRFERYMMWPQLRRQLLPWLFQANDTLAQLLLSRVAAMETLVLPAVEEMFALAPGQLSPRPLTQVLDETLVVGTRLSRLFTPAPVTGITPFVTQLLQLLERSVIGMFFDDPTTPQVAQKVVGTRTRAGREVPVVTKGTVANAWRERFRSITAAVLWAPVTPAAERAAEIARQSGVVATVQWRWNAVLDPRTCPRCRPLHGRVEDAPDEFPEGPPPLHPLCRCVLIPQISR
jgi:SPP1 gp7 family putative phage head morphogenesis protein